MKQKQPDNEILLIEYSKRYFFLKNHAENETGGLVPDLFFVYI